jgi:hypothetical protein
VKSQGYSYNPTLIIAYAIFLMCELDHRKYVYLLIKKALTIRQGFLGITLWFLSLGSNLPLVRRTNRYRYNTASAQ